jgi:ankyrin repeat protein
MRKLDTFGLCAIYLAACASSVWGADRRLVDAAEKDDKDAIRSLVKQRADVNGRQADGATPLAWAAYHDDLEMADLLIKAGADARATNDYGVTPLALACTNGSGAMVERFLQAGAIVGDKEFMECVRTGNLDAVKSMISREAHINAKEPREDQTALMWAAAEKHLDVLKTLIEKGADVRAHSRDGFTALMFAVQQNDLEAVKALLAAGANLNEATLEGDTPLLIAAESGYQQLGIYLLDQRANPNVADESGFAPLHFCFMKGLALVDRIRIPEYATFLVRDDMLTLAKALLDHGANPDPRVKKWSDKMMSTTRGLPYPGSLSPVGATPYMLAAEGWDAGAMRMLAAAGADPKMKTETPPGVVLGHDGLIEESVLKKLVAAGIVEPAEQGPWEVNALMLASGISRRRSAAAPLLEEEETRALEAVKVALEMGVDINAKDSLGLTALHAAAFVGANRIVQYLVENGADINARDISGQTPLQKALNIKPTGTFDKDGKFNVSGVHRSLIPYWVPAGTAELLLKLGATPVDGAVGKVSGVTPSTSSAVSK